jgi:hypothetical protein
MVVPDGNLRFALTARHIKPENFSEEERKLGVWDEALAPRYDGD